MKDFMPPIFVFLFVFVLASTFYKASLSGDTENKSQWSIVDDHKWGVTSRLKIPGGYLYRDTFRGESVSLCFVPDVAVERS